MKIIYLFLILSLGTAWATDPFDNRQQQSVNGETNTRLAMAIRCVENQPRLFSETPFNQIKIVGVLGLKTQKQVLLQNEEQRVVSATEGILVGEEGYKLQNIERQLVQFLSWKKDCRAGDIITRNF